MELSPIAIFHSPFKSKFGIPKQSGLVASLEGEVHLLPEYSDKDFIRCLEGFDFIWLIWQFHNNKHPLASSVVRPPLLGGNEKVGVFASRSPFRPNAIGLSSVRLLGIEQRKEQEGIILRVGGADLLDGTPIFDIKPYIPYTDSHEGARAGFVDDHPLERLNVEMDEAVVSALDDNTKRLLRELLALDPRPHYQTDEDKVYGMAFMDYDIKFRVVGKRCIVLDCCSLR